MRNMLTAFLLCAFVMEGQTQDSIELTNPSFEWDKPAIGQTPRGWINMGSDQESPPDIQPGYFGVELSAHQGKSYVGLVTRENNTWEGIGQRLKSSLKKDSAYTLAIHLAHADNMIAQAQPGAKEVRYDAPAVLKIWGFNSKTKKEELLAESLPVDHAKWMLYNFTLRPTLGDYDEIDLMAFYPKGKEGTNGNILIDNCSAIVQIVQ